MFMSPTGKLFVFCLVLLTGLLSVPAQNPAAAAPCEPRIDTASLLTNVDVNGSLRIGEMYARCLPMPEKKGRTAFQYHPYDGGKLSTVLKSSDGKTLNTFVWYAHSIQSLWEMSRYEVIGGREALQTLKPGSYMLEFALEDKVFQKFAFSVTTKQSSDQFKPETLYYTDGPWRDYAHLYAPNIDRFFQLGVWLRSEDSLADPKRISVPFQMRLIRESDKKTLAESDGSKLVLTHKWHNFSLSFRRPNAAQTKDYSEIKLSEVVAQDGRYRIELAVEGRPKADYRFTVKNGQINGIDLAQMRKDLYRIIIPLSREGSGK